jgi:hypothetical protein
LLAPISSAASCCGYAPSNPDNPTSVISSRTRRSRSASAPVLDPERDVLGQRQPRQKPVLLEHQAALGARTRNASTVDANSPVVFAVETRDDSEQRALAAPARPDQRQRLPRLDHQIELPQHRCFDLMVDTFFLRGAATLASG